MPDIHYRDMEFVATQREVSYMRELVSTNSCKVHRQGMWQKCLVFSACKPSWASSAGTVHSTAGYPGGVPVTTAAFCLGKIHLLTYLPVGRQSRLLRVMLFYPGRLPNRTH